MAKINQQPASAPRLIQEVQPSVPKRFLVELPRCLIPQDIVEAETAEEAYEVFKAKHGIIKSDHTPRIVLVQD